MSGDQRREHQELERRSRAILERREGISTASVHGTAHDGEFESPTRPRGYTVTDAEPPSESRIHVTSESPITLNGPAARATQDSFNPVRVPARTVRPPLKLWTRAWATVALVIVVAGGAVGVVAGLRGRTFGASWRAQRDRPNAAAAQQAAPARAAEGASSRAAMPAAAPGYTAPPPVAPSQGAARAAEPLVAANPSAGVPQETSTASPVAATPPRVSPGLTIYRTTESLAVSPPVVHAGSASPPPSRRAKPAETEPRPVTRTLRADEAPHAPTPAPTTSETPEKKVESEAWITEERRF